MEINLFVSAGYVIRKVIANSLEYSRKDSCILLDVGEGTCGQIYRFYGSEAPNVICKIKAVYVSHLHADHHIGSYALLQSRPTTKYNNWPILSFNFQD